MSKYRGFRGRVSPLGVGLGYMDRSSWDANLDTSRFPGAITFCGRKDYAAYVAKHGAPPAGSHIIDQPSATPICAGQTAPYVAPVVTTAYVAPKITPTLPLDVISAEDSARLKETVKYDATAQEFEATQYSPGGNGVSPALEQRAATDAATRAAIEAGDVPPDAQFPDEEAPNLLPLFLAAALIYVMA